MRPSVGLLRFMAALISVFCAHFLGRNAARRQSVLRWALRYVLAVAALSYFGIDALAIGALVLGAALFALGWWLERRPKPQEDLTKTIFGGEDEDTNDQRPPV